MDAVGGVHGRPAAGMQHRAATFFVPQISAQLKSFFLFSRATHTVENTNEILLNGRVSTEFELRRSALVVLLYQVRIIKNAINGLIYE